MRAAVIESLDGPRAIAVREVPEPSPAQGEVVIEVKAAGVCFPETLLSRGQYQIKPDLPFVPGSEVSGVVAHAEAGSGYEVGDRVMAFPGFGGFAERVAVNSLFVHPLPDGLDFTQGAAIPMNYLTAQFALDRRGRLAVGESVLVHGAAGGIGTAAIQIAKARGARVIAVASTQERRDIAMRAGADEAIAVDGFREQTMELTGGRGVDVVLDPVGGERFTDSLRALATEGRLLVVGFTGGSIPEVKVNRLLLNNIDVIGVGWGAFWMPRPKSLTGQWEALAPLLANGAIDPVIGGVRPLDQVAATVADLEERRALGKLVLEI